MAAQPFSYLILTPLQGSGPLLRSLPENSRPQDGHLLRYGPWLLTAIYNGVGFLEAVRWAKLPCRAQQQSTLETSASVFQARLVTVFLLRQREMPVCRGALPRAPHQGVLSCSLDSPTLTLTSHRGTTGPPLSAPVLLPLAAAVQVV